MNAVDESVAGRVKRMSGQHPDLDVPASPARASSLDGWLLSRLSTVLGEPAIELAIRDRARVAPPGDPVARVTFANRATLLAILPDPPLRFGDAYSDGNVTIEGDLVQLLEAVYHAGAAADKPASLLRRATGALHRPHRNTLAGSRDNIHRHYDIGNDFYALWLGSTMAYTCAYYPTPAATLDEAQAAKMDHVCRKLRLKPRGERRRGGLRLGHARAAHGAPLRRARARLQYLARAGGVRARARGARGPRGPCRVRRGRLPQHRRALRRLRLGRHARARRRRRTTPTLGRGGAPRAARSRPRPHSLDRPQPPRAAAALDREAHLPGRLPAGAERDGAASSSPRNLSVLDVENLRLHYAQTLRHWLGLFEGASERVREMFDEKFVRMWRLYLAGSIAGFTTGTLQLFQVLFAPGESNDVPWTRADIYAR